MAQPSQQPLGIRLPEHRLPRPDHLFTSRLRREHPIDHAAAQVLIERGREVRLGQMYIVIVGLGAKMQPKL